MKRIAILEHEFVEFIPDDIKDGIIYVSVNFATVTHKCCCGCGKEVVTPLSPTDWQLIFDGKSISLHPSIGNWGFDCKSHYWIKNNRVKWSARCSQEEIARGRSQDRLAKKTYYGGAATLPGAGTERQSDDERSEIVKKPRGFWSRIKAWCSFRKG